MATILDPAAGVAQLGSRRIPIRLTGRGGALQVGGDAGPTVRPLAFFERSRLVAHAAAAADPARAAARLIAEAALEQPGDADPSIVAAIALALAGAEAADLPSFGEAALLLARAAGWTPSQLAEMEARAVDHLAGLLAPPVEAESGWTRIVFAPPPPAAAGDPGEVAAICDRLAENLLGRLRAAGPLPLPDAGRWESVFASKAPADPAAAPAPDPSAAGGPPRWRLVPPRGENNRPENPLHPIPTGQPAGESSSKPEPPARASRQPAGWPAAPPPVGLTPIRHEPAAPEFSQPVPPPEGLEPAGGLQALTEGAAGSTGARPFAGPDLAALSGFSPTPTPAGPSPTSPGRPGRNPNGTFPPRRPTGTAVDEEGIEPMMTPADPPRPAHEVDSRPAAGPQPLDLDAIAADIAARLHLEADLRGIDR